MTRVRTAAVLVPFFAVGLGTLAQAGEYTVWGIGNRSCGEWTVAHASSDDRRYATQSSWLGGYMSAFNNYGPLASGTPHVDFDGMEAWITNYCTKNPLEKLSIAAERLGWELLRREQR